MWLWFPKHCFKNSDRLKSVYFSDVLSYTKCHCDETSLFVSDNKKHLKAPVINSFLEITNNAIQGSDIEGVIQDYEFNTQTNRDILSINKIKPSTLRYRDIERKLISQHTVKKAYKIHKHNEDNRIIFTCFLKNTFKYFRSTRPIFTNLFCCGHVELLALCVTLTDSTVLCWLTLLTVLCFLKFLDSTVDIFTR